MQKKTAFTVFSLVLTLSALNAGPASDPRDATKILTLMPIEEFESLDPEKKVETLIQEYTGYTLFGFRLDFSKKAERIANEKEKTLPYMMSLLRYYETHPYGSEKNEVDILNHIVVDLVLYGKIEKSVLNELTEIYTNLMDTYLKSYKKIDPIAIVLEESLTLISQKKCPKRTMGWVKRIHKKYKQLGYKDIIIDYEELWRVCKLE